jgi:GTPase SAR1 family protein
MATSLSASSSVVQMEKIRCLIVGDDNSGVASLALSYLSSFPSAEELSSREINSGYERKAVMVDGAPSTLCLWWGHAVANGIWTDPSFEYDNISSSQLTTTSASPSASSSVPIRTTSIMPGSPLNGTVTSSVMADAALICVDIITPPARVTGIVAMWAQRIRSRFPNCCIFLVGTKTDQRAPLPKIVSRGRDITISNDGSPSGRTTPPLAGSHRGSSNALSRSGSTNIFAQSGTPDTIPSTLSSSPSLLSSSSLSSSSSIADAAGLGITTTTRRYLSRDEGYACATAAETGTPASLNNTTANSVRYVECSARTRDGVASMFELVVQTVRHQRMLASLPPPTKSKGGCVIC